MKKLLLANLLMASIACWTQSSSSSSSNQGSSGMSSSTQSQSPSGASSQGHTGRRHHAASASGETATNDTAEHTMTGCLVARNNEFFLRTKGHHGAIELLSSDDLTAHNGHEVTVTGTWANKETVAEHEKNEEQDKSSAEKNNHARRERNERHFQVSKLDMVADHCTMPGKTRSSAGTAGSSSAESTPK